MSNYIGGYVLVPITQGVALGDLARNVSENLTVTPRFGFPPDAVAAAGAITQLLTDIERVHQGNVSFLVGGVDSLFVFETPIGSYHRIRIAVDEALFNRRSSRWNPATLDTFAVSWSQICEDMQAEYGYFSPYTLMAYEEYFEKSVLPYIAGKEVQSLLQKAGSVYWLSYYGPHLINRWPERTVVMSLMNPKVALTEMFSGAASLRNDEQKPINT